MGGRIFVNYRREDSAANAIAIASYLERKFGPSRVFIDVDRLRAGQNFADELEKRLAACTVMLTLIGAKWLEVTDEAGARRLDDPQDWVRLEIERALARKIVVIPVLTGGASLPKARDLPDALKPLTELQIAVVTTNSFRNDMAGLVRDMHEIMGGPKWGLIGAAAGLWRSPELASSRLSKRRRPHPRLSQPQRWKPRPNAFAKQTKKKSASRLQN